MAVSYGHRTCAKLVAVPNRIRIALVVIGAVTVSALLWLALIALFGSMTTPFMTN
jgi:hypothetical protein